MYGLYFGFERALLLMKEGRVVGRKEKESIYLFIDKNESNLTSIRSLSTNENLGQYLTENDILSNDWENRGRIEDVKK